MSPPTVLSFRPLAAGLAFALGTLPSMAFSDEATRAPATTPTPNAFRTVSNCNDAGAGSFRQAMVSALTGDIVDLRDLPCSKITLTTGAVTTSAQSLTIYGPGTDHLEINGNANSSLIRHSGFGTMQIDNLRLTNGKYSTSASAVGGCIYSHGSVTLDHSIVSGCVVESSNGSAKGGAIFASNAVILQNSIVSTGIADSDSGTGRGGGIYAGTLATQDSTIEGNATNGAVSEGGGAFVLGNSHFERSTISGNSADLAGGLLLNFNNVGDTRYAILTDDTISGNSATHVGGVFVRSTLYLTSSTITLNKETSQSGAGLYAAGAVRAIGSIIAGNTVNGSPCDLGGGNSTVISQNSEKNIIGLSLIPSIPSDTMSTDPQLGPLRDNGGVTRTHAPAAGSPAINHGQTSTSDPWDGRGNGFPRKIGAAVDIGAFEVNGDIIFANGFN